MKKGFISLLAMALMLSGGIEFAQPAFSASEVAPRAVSKEQTVYFNTNSRKYHKPSCEWAIKCTRNCISLPKLEARKRGGIACKVCGG